VCVLPRAAVLQLLRCDVRILFDNVNRAWGEFALGLCRGLASLHLLLRQARTRRLRPQLHSFALVEHSEPPPHVIGLLLLMGLAPSPNWLDYQFGKDQEAIHVLPRLVMGDRRQQVPEGLREDVRLGPGTWHVAGTGYMSTSAIGGLKRGHG